MPRPYTPRSALALWIVSLLLLGLSFLALATGQPIGAFNLCLGMALGINAATFVMVQEVRKARGDRVP